MTTVQEGGMAMSDPVQHPDHYGTGRFGIECIRFTRYMTFSAGNAFKYIWRHEDKGDGAQDLRKAMVYGEWAAEDHRMFGTNAVLPGFENHLTLLAAEHLMPRLPNLPHVYTALYYILIDRYSEADNLVMERRGEVQ